MCPCLSSKENTNARISRKHPGSQEADEIMRSHIANNASIEMFSAVATANAAATRFLEETQESSKDRYRGVGIALRRRKGEICAATKRTMVVKSDRRGISVA